jgi:hypothetical protein
MTASAYSICVELAFISGDRLLHHKYVIREKYFFVDIRTIIYVIDMCLDKSDINIHMYCKHSDAKDKTCF